MKNLADRIRSLCHLGTVGVAVLLVLPVLAAALFYVWAEITTIRLGYLLAQAGDAHRALLEENRGLRIEVSALRAPERLMRLADQYRLEPPKSEQVVRLQEDER
jgi:cell division protein FtsL